MLAVFILLGVLLGAPDLASAFGEDTLRGIRAFSVEIQQFDQEAIDAGLQQDSVRTTVELRLRQSQIKIIPAAYPQLLVTFTITRQNPYAITGYNITLAMVQHVLLRGKTTSAVTWSYGYVGYAGRASIAEQIQKALELCVDKFLNDYLAVNRP